MWDDFAKKRQHSPASSHYDVLRKKSDDKLLLRSKLLYDTTRPEQTLVDLPELFCSLKDYSSSFRLYKLVAIHLRKHVLLL